jgi:hypothetical protein
MKTIPIITKCITASILFCCFIISPIFVNAQNTFYVKEIDKVEATFTDPRLESEAILVSQLTTVQAGAAPFKIYTYNLYPVLAAVNKEYGMDARREEALAALKTKDYYFGIIKEYVGTGEDVEIKFTVDIKLPEGIAYNEIKI